jgi:hypothetical protein
MIPLAVMLAVAACTREEMPARRGPAANARAEAAERPVLASVTNESSSLRVQVVDVARVGQDSMRVELAVMNLVPAGTAGSEVEAVRESVAALAGLSVVTADGRRRVFPLRDQAGAVVWSGLEAPGPGEQRRFWVHFPVPTGRNPMVTVVVPGLPPMKDVPVS